MAHDTEQIKADAAKIAKGICPETGRDLSTLDPEIIRAHAALTFPYGTDPRPDRADHCRRYRLVIGYADTREKAKKAASAEA